MDWIYVIFESLMRMLELSVVITGLVLVRRDWHLSYKLLIALFFLIFCYSTFIFITLLSDHNNYQWLYRYWIPFEVTAILYFVTRQATRQWVRNLFFWYLLYLGVAVFFAFWHQKDPFAGIVYEVLFMQFATLIVCFATIIDVLMRSDDVSIFRVPVFWIAAGLIIFSALTTVIFSIPLKFLRLSYAWYRIFSTTGNIVEDAGFLAGIVLYSRERRDPLVAQ